MKGLKLCQGRNGACHSGVTAGAALILTLAFIVILTALVLLFITHSLLETQVSVASADQTAAALFARGAVDSVVGELKQEITAGSQPANGGATFPPSGSDVRNPDTVFLPSANQAMVPYRMDPGAPPNVLKRSSSNELFYPVKPYYSTSWAGPKWAVPYSTTNVDTSGRTISLARWNAPLLMPTTNTPGSGETNLTPVSSFIPPDWIYFRRMTAVPATAWNANLIPNMASGALNPDYVIGRYAYVVYDEGGLLDANAAGYPSAALDGSSITPVMIRHKISEACADLTQIGLNSSDINALVAWRNPINDATATTYTNYVYSETTNAFLTPAPGERMFTSRQQLIDFLTQNVAGNNPVAVERMQGALPYLTTFSRELNQPCWYPQTNMAASGYSYTTTATSTPASATNAFAPLERAGSMYTNSSGLVCNANQPLAFSRFPLSRLSWLGTNGPANNATAVQIQQSFGLVWDSSGGSANCAWIYAGPSPGTTALSTITPLSQISGREPNFFELLKAAILSGSVGVTPASGADSNFGAAGYVDPRYSQYDQQVMAIGLAMIDQSSSALLPTRIEFGANTGTAALYGNKSLPYVYRFTHSPYRPTTEPPDIITAGPGTGTYTQAWYDAWAEPIFWNPYQTVVTNTAPLEIRLRGNGTNGAGFVGNIYSVTEAAQGNGFEEGQSSTPDVGCAPAGPNTANNVNGSSIELDAASAATFSSAAANPVLLASILTNTVNPVINDIRASSAGGGSWTGGPANADIYPDPSGVTYAGFWLGHALAPNPPDPDAPLQNGSTTVTVPYGQALLYSGTKPHRSTAQIVTEANYGTISSPNFLEIQRMCFAYTTDDAFEYDDNFTVAGRRMNLLTIPDPRTGRFASDIVQLPSYNPGGTSPASISAADQAQVISTTYPSSADVFSGKISYQITSSSAATITPAWPASGAPPSLDTFRFADNSSTASANTTPNYQDTDGAQRAGDGWWNSASTTANTLPMREDTPQDRPVFLGRPFYSVGELGYVFRDTPWRSLDFSTAGSADAGLLDFFCVNDGYAGSTNAPVVAGVLDLNTQNPQVLQAMLNGADRAQLYPGTSSSNPVGYDVAATDATNMANAITNITANLPLLNKSELATRVAPADPTVLANATAEPGIDTNIKERREAIVRALASTGQVRTWNLMIDVIAQTGHFPPNATGFNNFIVTAEQRYWAHVAIDRYTGQVVSIQLEPVSE